MAAVHAQLGWHSAGRTTRVLASESGDRCVGLALLGSGAARAARRATPKRMALLCGPAAAALLPLRAQSLRQWAPLIALRPPADARRAQLRAGGRRAQGARGRASPTVD